MTFRHTKFEDSPTMRALEKVAQEKGLVKSEPALRKEASQLDLTPTANLMENVLKLCAGLRRQGLEKEAAEIETNYLKYRQAQTMYEVSPEKGEDVINAAHPEGSHKMENVEENKAVFYTILDRHLKYLDMVKKNPTGKLSEASQIIQAVKTVLGQSTKYQPGNLNVYVSGLAGKAYSELEGILAVADKELSIADIPGTERHISRFNASDLREKFSTLLLNSPGREEIKSAQDLLDRLEQRLMPSAFGKLHVFEFLASGVSTAAWSKLQPQIEQVRLYFSKAIAALDAGKVPESELPKTTEHSVAPTTQPTHAFQFLMQQQRLKSLISKVQAWAAVRSIAQNPQATQWIKDELKSLNDVSTRYSAVDKDQEENMVPNFKREIDEEQADIADFESKWVASRT